MNKIFRANRTRAKIHGTEERPRLTVHISNLNVTAQIINDDAMTTLAYATTVGKKNDWFNVRKKQLKLVLKLPN